MNTNSNFEKFKINYDKIKQSYWNNSLTKSNLTKLHNERVKVVLEHVKMNSVLILFINLILKFICQNNQIGE
jgi:hypothetical protein